MSTFRPCECEHVAHFERAQRTPFGKAGHGYGAQFSRETMCSVQTPRGIFVVCAGCQEDCMGSYPAVPVVRRAAEGV